MRSLLLISFFAVACGENPADLTPDAQVVKPDATPASGEKPDTVAVVDPGNRMDLTGHIHFTGSKVRGSHTCRFDRWSGFLNPGTGSSVDQMALAFDAETKSVFCDWETRPDGYPKLEKHLRAEDFFFTESHPKARFVSTKIQAGEGDLFQVTGDFTLRGVTNTITFPATISWKEGSFSANARFDINRKDWGVSYPGAADNLIRNEVVLDIALKGG
jgi:polyisoprenoid-binding protein YceI